MNLVGSQPLLLLWNKILVLASTLLSKGKDICLNITLQIHISTTLGSTFGISVNDFIAGINPSGEDSRHSNEYTYQNNIYVSRYNGVNPEINNIRVNICCLFKWLNHIYWSYQQRRYTFQWRRVLKIIDICIYLTV